ncbi:MAG: hypothetical protein J0G33_08870 [Afipia felis]|nr:hypothetical protein [Afipia felis]
MIDRTLPFVRTGDPAKPPVRKFAGGFVIYNWRCSQRAGYFDSGGTIFPRRPRSTRPLAVAAMLPVTVIIAVRTGIAPSQLMIPLALACLKGAKLTMLGSPVNVIAATQAEEFGAGHIGFFAWSVLGIPQLIGSIIIVIFLGKRLLPERQSESIPADFSGHAQTLVQHYNPEHGLHQLAVPATSPLVGTSRKAVDLSAYAGVLPR